MQDQSSILIYVTSTFKRELEEVKQEMINENVEINEDLFNNLYEITSKTADIVRLVNSTILVDRCYCDENKCSICTFIEYVKYTNFENELKNYQLLDIISQLWVLIDEIKQNMTKLNKTDLDFLFY